MMKNNFKRFNFKNLVNQDKDVFGYFCTLNGLLIIPFNNKKGYGISYNFKDLNKEFNSLSEAKEFCENYKSNKVFNFKYSDIYNIFFCKSNDNIVIYDFSNNCCISKICDDMQDIINYIKNYTDILNEEVFQDYSDYQIRNKLLKILISLNGKYFDFQPMLEKVEEENINWQYFFKNELYIVD